MGNKTTEEKLPLMEFLYRDSELIGSLYSQVFGGDLQGVSQLAGTTEESNVDGGVNIGFANSKLLTKDIVNEQIIKNIISKDEKIIELFSELNIKEYTKSLNNCKSGKILKIEGDMYFRNLDTFKNIFPILKDMGFLPKEIFDGNSSDELLNSFINFVSKSLPGGLQFELLNKQFEKLNCFINEKFLISDVNDIAKNFSNKFLGKWTVVGIFDNILPKKNNLSLNSKSEIKQGIDQTEEFIFQFLNNEEIKFVIKPIIIYRVLDY